MKKILKIGVCAVVIALSAHTVAQEFGSGQMAPMPANAVKEKSTSGHIVAKASTMGLGIEYNHPINSVLSLGFGVNQFTDTQSSIRNNINYSNDVNLESASIILNYHPYSNGFRLRTGVYYNNNRVGLTATSSTGDVTINGVTFTGADVKLEGDVSFQKLSPYLGIGYGSEPTSDSSLSFDFDIGVMSSPTQTELNGSCFVGGVQSVGICATSNFDAELAKERKSLANDFDFEVYPVVSLGFAFHF